LNQISKGYEEIKKQKKKKKNGKGAEGNGSAQQMKQTHSPGKQTRTGTPLFRSPSLTCCPTCHPGALTGNLARDNAGDSPQ
jgi:hypothetical protein